MTVTSRDLPISPFSFPLAPYGTHSTEVKEPPGTGEFIYVPGESHRTTRLRIPAHLTWDDPEVFRREEEPGVRVRDTVLALAGAIRPGGRNAFMGYRSTGGATNSDQECNRGPFGSPTSAPKRQECLFALIAFVENWALRAG